jgi:glycogen debranching enzyme
MFKPGLAIGIALALSIAASAQSTSSRSNPQHLELSRTARPWESLPVVGTRAGLFGNEGGRFEAWVYPLKILRDFHLQFHIDGEIIPADTLARTVSVRPESCTILYSSSSFRVRETFLVPVSEPGAIITLEIETTQPLEVEVVFERDFTLEWPASLGGTYLQWDSNLYAFFLGEEQNRFAAFVGSPSAAYQSEEYSTNYSSSRTNSFLLGTTIKGAETKTIIIAASANGRKEAEETYHRLLNTHDQLLVESTAYYSEYLKRTIGVELPDRGLQEAYDWSRISMIQGMVDNRFVGTSLVAGYNKSGDGQRPGFAWFFGRDSLWTALALDASGDFPGTRTVLDFLSKYQRKDGKITHEVPQSVTFVPWFEKYPYPYASADATPLFLIAMDDYVAHSGDVAFAQQKWDSIWNAYQYLHSTYDAQGLPQNAGVGHGWIEGGPLLPVKSELYQAGLATEALRAISNLARLTGKEAASNSLNHEFENLRVLINQAFWSPGEKFYAFALDPDGERVNIPSVLATVPMWFGLLDQDKSESTINHLADSDHQTDWGMRILSSRNPKYNPDGYHFGTVWPLFTGWASVGEYRYHRALPAYSNLRSNAQLALDGSLGHVTEVLSGNYYTPTSGGTPDQVWSAAMVVGPLLKGLLGLDVDATSNRIVFAPHVPADWSSFQIRNIRVGSVALDLEYERTADMVMLNVTSVGRGDYTFEFNPAFSLRAELVDASINGRSVVNRFEPNSEDQHLALKFPIQEGRNIVQIRVRKDFELGIEPGLPALGSPSRGLRVISQSWDAERNNLTLDVAGIPGEQYELRVLNSAQIEGVEGATVTTDNGQQEARLTISFPPSEDHSYQHSLIAIHLKR